MKFLYTVSLISFAAFLSSCSINHRDIKPEKFRWYYKTRKVRKLLVDTRDPERYREKHIENAVNIPLREPEFKKKIKEAVAQKADDVWVLFVYAEDEKSTLVLKNKLEELYSRHFPFSGPGAVFYLQGGFISLPGEKGLRPGK